MEEQWSFFLKKNKKPPFIPYSKKMVRARKIEPKMKDWAFTVGKADAYVKAKETKMEAKLGLDIER